MIAAAARAARLWPADTDRHGASEREGLERIAGRPGNFELRGRPRLGDLGELAMRLPLPSAARGRVLVVGGLYIDVVSEVAEFPREDSACRALATWRSRGALRKRSHPQCSWPPQKR